MAEGRGEPKKYWLSNLPAETALKDLVWPAHRRWIVEWGCPKQKQELRQGQFEGLSCRGFHHHATLCIAANGFLVANRSRFSPGPARAA